ncbi:MAG: leucine-rich repeat domain-containing protein [Verrucomicrobiia bacterium]
MRLRVLLLLSLLPAAVQAQFTYTTNNGAITITRYTGSSGAVTIPGTINGLPVTCIGSGAFALCGLTNVIIPSSVTTLGSNVFYECYNLVNITISNGVTNIGDSAFFDCSSLTRITLPNSVASLGSGVFTLCGLTSILIPNSIASIGTDTFYECYNLTNITIPNSVTSIGDGAFYYCSSLTSITIPNSISSIGNEAFRDSGLVSLAIPDSVTSVGTNAFFECFNLANIMIPNGVTSIGPGAFQWCYRLTNVTIPIGVTEVGSRLFYACYSLTNVTIPASVTSLGGGAFYYCSSLPGITIPNSVTSLGAAAFGFCTNLPGFAIPASVTNIQMGAFLHCSSLSVITVDPLNAAYSSVAGVLFDKSQTTLIAYPEGRAGSYSIPASVTSLGNQAFEFCVGLTGITIPAGVTNIQLGAFLYCNRLSAIAVDPLNTAYRSVAGVLFDKSQTTLIAYPEGKAGNYTIPAGIINLASYAFAYCTNLNAVYFLGNVPSTDSTAFSGDNSASVYYLSGTTGWLKTFGGRPTVLWNPQVQTSGANFGVRTNRFGFNIAGTSNLVIVVEASTNLVNPAWSPVGTNILANGLSYFSDQQLTNYHSRFYRLSAP